MLTKIRLTSNDFGFVAVRLDWSLFSFIHLSGVSSTHLESFVKNETNQQAALGSEL